MRHLRVIIWMAVILAACAGASSTRKLNCSKRGEICVEVRAEEPIRPGEPITVTVTVTSEKDIAELAIALYHDIGAFEEEAQAWEKDVKSIIDIPGGKSWVVDINAEQPLSYSRKYYPQYEEGWFSISASAGAIINTSAGKTSSRATDGIKIHLTRDGGEVYMVNTPLPITPGPGMLVTMNPDTLATMQAWPTATPWPTMMSLETSTPHPSSTMKPTETPTPLPGSKTESPPPVIMGTPAYPPPVTPYP